MKLKAIALVALLIGLLAACGGAEEPLPTATSAPPPTATSVPPTEAPSGETVRGQATVDSIEIEILESFPVQVNVIARGELSDGCTEIDNVIQQLTDQTFSVVITTVRPGDRVCTQALVPFTETVSLDVAGLDAGNYAVNVNGRTGTFTLDVDNRATAPTATPEPAAPESGNISGVVWHDLCAVTGGEGGADTLPADGCVADPDGGFLANGVLDTDEPGIAGVQVALGEGACPADGLETAVTDADGGYRFTDLPAGEYCVSVDALAAENEPTLLPGGWTFPGIDQSASEVALAAGGAETGVNFGWDYQFLPIPVVDPDTCVNSFEYVSDLTIPDDTELAPGAEFTKEWRIRNNGTCPWTEGYRLVAVDEEPLEGETEVPLTRPVAPGQTLDVAVNLVAPEVPGTYRSNWQMANVGGELFGLNGFIEDAIFTRIIVTEAPGPTPSPNTAVLGGVVWSDFCTVSASGTPSAGCLETAAGSGRYIGNGTYNSYDAPLADVEVSLARGACPTDGTLPNANIADQTLTDADGNYEFAGVAAGTYCLFVNAFSPANLNLLIPGDWTFPAPGVGLYGLIVSDGDERLRLDFGWDDL